MAVLQIQKIRNISAPKANESSKTAPKLLKLQLTDGVNTYSAIEMESTALSIETKPGSKVWNPFSPPRVSMTFRIDFPILLFFSHFLQTPSSFSFQIALKVKHLKTTNGQLLLTPKNIEILGGYVEALVTKWELTRSLAGIKSEDAT